MTCLTDSFLKYVFQAPKVLILQDGSQATSQPGSPAPLALGTVSHAGTDPAQCLTVVTPASALTALTVWKVGCPGYLFCIVCHFVKG